MSSENELLRIIIRRLFDGWIIGNDCDPGDAEEFAWEWSGLVAPGSFDFKREPFEPGVRDLLWTFDPLDEGPAPLSGTATGGET